MSAAERVAGGLVVWGAAVVVVSLLCIGWGVWSWLS